jgi:hypothetical protein
MVLAHIAGIPVEETALSFGPVMLLAGGVASARIRERVRDGRRRRPGGRTASKAARRR